MGIEFKFSNGRLFSVHTLMIIIFASGCASDIPIKTVRDENSSANSATTSDTTGIITAHNGDNNVSQSNRQSPKTNSKDGTVLNEDALRKIAYELGIDASKPLNEEQKNRVFDRRKLRQLERSLDSQKERQQYSKILPLLENDAEKIELLSIPGIEGRQVWINNKKIWERTKQYSKFDDLVDSQDLALGMPIEYVKRSWGEPTSVEVSGNPIYRNERWNYLKQVSTANGYKQERRIVYFEEGRVAGWETE